MTEDDLNALRVKVAELCPNIRFLEVEGCAGGLWQFYDGEFWQGCLNNDVLSDLNACAEFEKELTGWQPVNYKDHLRTIVGDGHHEPSAFDLLTATAEQRCRAFVALHEGTT